MNQSESSSFIVGLILAVSSCWFIGELSQLLTTGFLTNLVYWYSYCLGASFIIKKLGLQRFSTDHSQLRASDGGFGYLKEWIWWAGVLTSTENVHNLLLLVHNDYFYSGCWRSFELYCLHVCASNSSHTSWCFEYSCFCSACFKISWWTS